MNISEIKYFFKLVIASFIDSRFKIKAIECGENEEYAIRSDECPRTCLYPDGRYDCGSTAALEGCFCKKGYVLNSFGKCVDVSFHQLPRADSFQKRTPIKIFFYSNRLKNAALNQNAHLRVTSSQSPENATSILSVVTANWWTRRAAMWNFPNSTLLPRNVEKRVWLPVHKVTKKFHFIIRKSLR